MMNRILIGVGVLMIVGCSPDGPEQSHMQACPEGQQPMHALAVDLDGDGVDELAISCAGSGVGTLQVFSFDKSGGLSTGQSLALDQRVLSAGAWPRTDDGESLLIGVTSPSERQLLFSNVGDAGQLGEPVVVLSAAGEISRMSISDVNEDGNPDIVIPDIDIWLENLGSAAVPGPFRSQPIQPGIEWRKVFGKIGTLAGLARPAGTYILQNQGVIRIFSLSGVTDIALGPDTEQIFEVLAAGDLNDDGTLDLVVTVQTAPIENRVHLVLSSGDGQWRLTEQVSDLENPATVILEDFDGDGRIDLLMAPIAGPNQEKYSLSLISGLSGQEFQSQREIRVSGFPYRMIRFQTSDDSPAVAYIEQESNQLHIVAW